MMRDLLFLVSVGIFMGLGFFAAGWVDRFLGELSKAAESKDSLKQEGNAQRTEKKNKR